MSDLVPASSFSEVVKVIKLLSGEEIIGIIREASPDRITIAYPAKLETGYSKDENDNIIEYVKLLNYAINISSFQITIPRTAILFMGEPSKDLEKMYEIFYVTMQRDPNSIVSNRTGDIVAGPEAGLQLLNDLFNNEDFVKFVNELIDSFEGIEILEDDEEESEETLQNLLTDASTSDSDEEEDQTPPKSKKRPRMKPEGSNMPFNPEGNPNSAESWSDNPEDYI